MGELGKTGFSFPQQPIPALQLRRLALLKPLRAESCSCAGGEGSGGKQTLASLQHHRVEGFGFH